MVGKDVVALLIYRVRLSFLFGLGLTFSVRLSV